MEQILSHINRIKTAKSTDRVFKDECVFSFDSPVSVFNPINLLIMSCLGNGNWTLCLSQPVHWFGQGVRREVFQHHWEHGLPPHQENQDFEGSK